jgi:hypothetical protein
MPHYSSVLQRSNIASAKQLAGIQILDRVKREAVFEKEGSITPWTRRVQETSYVRRR